MGTTWDVWQWQLDLLTDGILKKKQFSVHIFYSLLLISGNEKQKALNDVEIWKTKVAAIK